MAVKRKRSTVVLDEGHAPKRQLRSGREIQTSPSTTSVIKPNVASRRAQPSPQKRVTSPKKVSIDLHSNASDDSEDDIAFPPTTPKRGRPVSGSQKAKSPSETRALSDETNFVRVSSNSALKHADKPRARRGRPPKSRLVEKTAGLEDEDLVSQSLPVEPDDEGLPSAPSERSKEATSLRRQPTRGTPTAEVIICTPSRRVKGSIAHATPKPTASTATTDSESSSSSDNEHEPPAAPISPTKKTSHLAEYNPSAISSDALPEHLYPCFHAYKRAILKTLQCPNVVPVNADQPSVNDVAAKQLTDLIDGTVLRAEGNSCLLLGPRGSGKSQMVDACLEKVAFEKPIILRLSGWVQSTDRHALREIAFQLLQQTGSSLLPDTETDQSSPVQEGQEEEENPFLDSIDTSSGEPTLSLPPSSHLHALIPVLLTLSRPVVVILDAFDLFALHPRQSLLYCLLDTVQNCRASSDSRGIAVIGITSRVDTVQLLEKRVKSRFSGRTIRTAPPGGLQSSLALVRSILQPSDLGDDDEYEEWKQHWTSSVDRFLTDKNVVNVFNETFSITRDLKVITRMLTTCVLRLTSTQPYLSFRAMSASVDSQRSRHRNLHLTNLSYPSLCLLIASAHADTAGHTTFTFEMLYETFRDQVRASTSAPVQVNGGSIGMVRCTREVLLSTFEDLIAARIFACVVGPSSNTAKEFMKHRCVVDRNVIKGIIEKSGQTNLKKWLNKGQ